MAAVSLSYFFLEVSLLKQSRSETKNYGSLIIKDDFTGNINSLRRMMVYFYELDRKSNSVSLWRIVLGTEYSNDIFPRGIM